MLTRTLNQLFMCRLVLQQCLIVDTSPRLLSNSCWSWELLCSCWARI